MQSCCAIDITATALLMLSCLTLARTRVIGNVSSTDVHLEEPSSGSEDTQNATFFLSDPGWESQHGEADGNTSALQQVLDVRMDPSNDLGQSSPPPNTQNQNVANPPSLLGALNVHSPSGRIREASQHRERSRHNSIAIPGASSPASTGTSVEGTVSAGSYVSTSTRAETNTSASSRASATASADLSSHSTATVSTPPMSVSTTASTTNPFLRVTQDTTSTTFTACSIPANLPRQVQELNSFLQDSHYIGLIPAQNDYSHLTSVQPTHNACPTPTGSWWPRPEVNLRSTCPWVWRKIDKGRDAYPRYIREANCLCQSCINANSHSCQEIRHDVTIFRLKSCQDGLAVMEKEVVSVTLGCFCAAPVPNRIQSGNPAIDPALPSTK